MNAKMKAILAKMREKHAAARAAQTDGDHEKATSLLGEFKELQREFNTEKELYEAEKAMVPNFSELEGKAKAGFEGATENGFTLIGKVLRGKRLEDKEMDILTGRNSEAGKALVTGGSQGENLLIPEDVRLTITELRKQYRSAKELVTVIPTASLTGSFNFEEGAPAGLQAFDDGSEIDATDAPKFVKKTYTIKLFGKLLPISNILTQIEQAGLLAYINKWFVKNAIVTENKSIFNAVKTGTPKSIKGLAELRKAINKDLDPDAMIGARIVTNQTGFAAMDEETDKNGRPLLQPDPTQPTTMLYKGYPVDYFSDTQLPNLTGGKAPLLFGSLDAADYFMDMLGYQFAVSEHHYFGTNQNCMRLIEGFDNFLADKDVYFYGAYEPPAEPAAG